MAKFLTVGIVGAVLGIIATWAAAYGKPGLAEFLNSPQTADVLTNLLQSVLFIVAGLGAGWAGKK